jgi:hypothetical protein
MWFIWSPEPAQAPLPSHGTTSPLADMLDQSRHHCHCRAHRCRKSAQATASPLLPSGAAFRPSTASGTPRTQSSTASTASTRWPSPRTAWARHAWDADAIMVQSPMPALTPFPTRPSTTGPPLRVTPKKNDTRRSLTWSVNLAPFGLTSAPMTTWAATMGQSRGGTTRDARGSSQTYQPRASARPTSMCRPPFPSVGVPPRQVMPQMRPEAAYALQAFINVLVPSL